MEAVAEYLTRWEEICKAVSKEKLKEFNEAFDTFKTVYKLTEGGNVDVHDYFVHYLDLHHSILEVDELENHIKKLDDLLLNVIEDFRERTGINLGMELDYQALRNDYYEDSVLFVLEWKDVVQLTPKAQQLKDMGFDFRLETSVINY